MHHGKLHLVGNHKSARASMAPNSKMHAAFVGGSEVTRRHELWVMPHFGKSEAVETLGIRIKSLVLEERGVGGENCAPLGDVQTIGKGVVPKSQSRQCG